MNDEREYGTGPEDLSLPKATVTKIISDVLSGHNIVFSRESRDLLIECCVEFIQLLSSEANEIAEKEAKKTISLEHIIKALVTLQFESYVPDIEAAGQEHKTWMASREKKQSKLVMSGLSDAELLEQQQALFRSAGEKYQSGP